MTPQYIFYKKSQMQAVKRIQKNPNRSGSQAMMICIMFFLFSINTNCKYSIKPSAFQITSEGGDPGSSHEISFDLNYAGSNGTSTLKVPTDAQSVAVQCSSGGEKDSDASGLNCNFKAGQTTLIPNAGEIVINDNDSFSSLIWNVKEHDPIGSDYYTISISSSQWKLSSNQCTPYEVRISVNTSVEVKNTKCYSANLKLASGLQVGSKIFKDSLGSAQASVGAEFGAGWQSCAEWTVPAKSYVLYANVVMNSPYPSISPIVPVCTSTRIAAKDGYGNTVFPYNPTSNSLQNWITWDTDGYYVKPLAANVGDHQLTLGVFGPCGERNLTTFLKVKPQPQYSTHSFTVDACTATKLAIKDAQGNVALPASPGTSLKWISYNNQTYLASPKLEDIATHSAKLTVASPCGTISVDASIVVNAEKVYPNVSYSVKACSSVRLTVKDANGVSVSPSDKPTTPKAWITSDAKDYIAKPTSSDIGVYDQSFILSMFSYCGSRDVTASVSVTNSEDFLIDKQIINAKNTDPVSYHNINIKPAEQVVTCQNFSSSNPEKYNWISISEAGLISLTPSGVLAGKYILKGVCSDKCGHSKESIIEINISSNIYASTNSGYFPFASIALAAVVYAMLF